jgi:DNA ligase 4
MFTLPHFFLIWNMFRSLSVSYIFSFITCFSEENAEPLDHKHEEQEEVVRSHAKHVPRKRSRAASSSRPARASPRTVRRTRARKGNQHARIDGDVESDESGPGEHQYDQNPDTDGISKMDGNNSEKDRIPPRVAPRPVRRARARRVSQHVKIDGEFEESSLGERDEEDQKLEEEYVSKMEEDNSGPPPGAQFFTSGEQEPKGAESNIAEAKTDSPFQRTSVAEVMMTSMPSEKMEQMVDPLQAMLLDMVPALRHNMAEDVVAPAKVGKDVPGVALRHNMAEDVVAPAKVGKDVPGVGSFTSNSENLLPQVGTSDVLTPDLNAAPTKKKKVSYKDVAGELLKDW